MRATDSTPNSGSAAPVALSGAAGRRVSNQLARAFHGTYGAETGLRMLVRSIARQMLVDGASRDAVRAAFHECVTRHPGRAASEAQGNVGGKPVWVALVELTEECIAEIPK